MTSSEDDTTFTKLFDEALLQYEQNTGKKIDDDAVLRRKVQSTEGMLSAIQDREKKFDKFRKTHSKLWEALRSTMKRVRGFGSLIQSGVSLTPFAPASFVVAAALSLVDVAASITDSYDTLETVFEKIEDITGRVEEYLETCMGMKLRRIVVKLLCTLLETFGESERLIRHGRSIEMIRRISGKESKVPAVLDRLEDLWKSEMGLVIATNYSTGQRTERKVDQIVSLSKEGKNRSEEDADRRTLETLLSVDPEQEMETFHARMDEIRLPDSGDWLFNEKVFQAWLEMKFPVLCVIGGPGVGKSYLASRVISYLKSQHGQNKSPTVSNSVAYFYIQEGNQSQQPLSVILKRIVYQITQTYAPYRRHTISVCERPDCLLTPGMIWTNLFLRFFENPRYTPLFIVIDGVDEACLEDQKTLLNLVKPLCDERNNSNVPMIQILLLGRNELEYGISNAWSESRRKPEIIRISPEKTRADIKSFITKGVKEIGLLNRLRQRELEAIKHSRLGLTSDSDRLQRKGLRLIQKFENEIILKLENSADGMFMWAKLMLDEIKNMNKPKLIKDALDKPPQSLRDMLQHIVKRLSVVGGFDKNDFNEILSWVACTKRDLLLGELDLVLKLRDLEESGVPGLEHELKTRFGSFFTLIDKNGGLVDGEDDDEHESVDGGLPDDSTGLSDITLHDEEYDSDEADLEDEDIWGDEKGDPFQETGPPPANFLTTTVKFSHASVGQHFRSEGVYLGIGIQLNSARAHVTYICLLILTDSIQKKHGKPWPTPNLLDYSLEHFLEHLAEVDMKSLKASEPSTYEKISKELSLLFGYGDIAKRMYLKHPDIRKLLGQIFSDNNSLIRCWLPENPNPDPPNSAHSKWERKAKKSARALFKPLARMVAELWLVRGTVYEWWAAIFLHEFMSIVSCVEPLPHDLSASNMKKRFVTKGKKFKRMMKAVANNVC
jgi:Cdc6-like AAA superfamily ATPase